MREFSQVIIIIIVSSILFFWVLYPTSYHSCRQVLKLLPPWFYATPTTIPYTITRWCGVSREREKVRHSHASTLRQHEASHYHTIPYTLYFWAATGRWACD
eukprot:scaffold45884_cov221-Amphora_coffeaeformis.AAC.1